MKIGPQQVRGFLARPPSEVVAVLVYGPDNGLVRERADLLSDGVVEDRQDPFRVVELGGDALGKDHSRLYDEASAISLMGGRRVIRVRAAADGLAPLFQSFLDETSADALVLLEAGELPARSKLRKLFEGSKRAAAIACYHDDAGSIADLTRSTFKEAGISADREVVSYLASLLGGDRAQTRGELEKLVMYKWGDSTPLTFSEVDTLVGDSAERSLDDLALAVADGRSGESARILSLALSEGVNASSVPRGLLRYFQRLHWCSSSMAQGMPADQAMSALRPPVFWKTKDRFQRHLRSFSKRALESILDRLFIAERDSRLSGIDVELMIQQLILDLTVWIEARNRR